MLSVVNLTTLLESVELTRRQRKYEEMCDHAEKLTLELDSSILGRRLYSKLLYELHMGEWQQYEESMKKEQEHLLASLELIKESVKEARAADDEVGALIDEENMYGLLYPELGKWQEGVEGCDRTCKRLEEIAADSKTTEVDRNRALRFVVNSYIHRIRMIVKFVPGDAKCRMIELLEWMWRIEKNPFYLSHRDEFQPSVEEIRNLIQAL